MKLGKIEKFILRYLWYYRRCVSNDKTYNHGYRSQILYVLYNLQQGNDRFSYRKNLKDNIPSKAYNRLQAIITRSTKSLENKGLIKRERLKKDFFRKRKFAFSLTDLGKAKAKELFEIDQIQSIKDVLTYQE